MSEPALRESQLAMARFLRNPENEAPPPGVEPRRLKVYQELIYNNIEGFISAGFPVLRSLYSDEDWHELVRLFIEQHRCSTPYFLEISQEFLRYLMEVHRSRDCDPPFMAELAHYEWVELALDVAEEELPPPHAVPEPLAARACISPLAWVLSYRYPVHRIGRGFRPTEAGEPSFLLVYRNRDDAVCFMELNAATARMLELFRDRDELTVAAVLAELAGELGMAQNQLQAFALDQLLDLESRGVLVFRGRSAGQ